MSDFGSSPSRRLMVMAGGTGGHIFPGLAVAEAVRAAGWQVVWLGNPEGMEARLVPARDFEMVGIRFSALRGKGLIRKLLLPFNLLRGFWQAWGALRRIRPDVVLGMGGYVTFPGGMMASLLGKPLLIHEQNAIAGLANKVLARLADRVLTGFPGALPQGVCVGNPVREDIAALPPPRERFADRAGPLRILVLGGSLGASALNETIPQGLALLPEHERPQIVHQAGAKHLATLAENYRHSGFDQVDGPQVTITAFIDDMAGAYTWADLVVCRSGALTVSELAAAGVASVLVPFPAAVDDHQRVNARFLSDADAAILVPQNELTPERIVDICRLGRARLLAMAENARALAKAEATKTVARVCMEMAGPTKS